MNDGRFRENGGCGYIRKPDSILTSSSEDLDEEITLSIRVLSGTCLPKPKAEKVGEVIRYVPRLHAHKENPIAQQLLVS